MDEVGRLEAVAGGEDAVARRRRAAALDVAEDGDPRLVARALLDLAGEDVADPAQAHVPELVGGGASCAICCFSPEAYVSS